MRDEDFERLYAAEAAGLFSFLAYRTGDRALAEDLLADTFERALRARRGFDRRRGSEKNWLYAIALNVVRDHARRNATAERALSVVAADAFRDSSQRPIDAVDTWDAIRQGMDQLAPADREVLALRFGADLTAPQIARLTGERLSAVEKRIYRA